MFLKMRVGSLLGIVLMVLFSSSISHASNENDCLFNWLEKTYPNFLAPAGGQSATMATYYYRYYAQTNSYIAIESTGGRLWYLVQGQTGLIDLGGAAYWLRHSGCLASSDTPANPIIGKWNFIHVEGAPPDATYTGYLEFKPDNTYEFYFFSPGYYNERGSGNYAFYNSTLTIMDGEAIYYLGRSVEITFSNSNTTIQYIDLDGDRHTLSK